MNRDDINDLLDRTSLDALNRTTNAAIDTLAIALLDTLDDDTDIIDAFRLATIRLAYALELCPLHECDAAICADDNDPECAELRD